MSKSTKKNEFWTKLFLEKQPKLVKMVDGKDFGMVNFSGFSLEFFLYV